ncbi:hypothetical protein WMF31_17730 [Sorangium sp. So ce1036]|uniref:hypothetical protein n=1 Tax=Sorangium sp. So ce1036 TaxID=3133328 RepID=UPI0013E9AEC5
MARVPLAAGAGALCAAAVWPGCNAILGIEAPEREGAGDQLDCTMLEVVPGEPLELSMIDDMEDGNTAIPKGDGAIPRQGVWILFHDNSEDGDQQPPHQSKLVEAMSPARGDSERGVHTSGNELFTEWGAGIGIRLSGYYDATAYRGVTFWARAEEGSSTDLFVTLVDQQTDNEGGICGDDEGQVPCYDHFHTIVTLTPDWKHFKVPAGCLVQTGYGVFEALAQDRIRNIQFSFGPGQAFDIWIDDVAFYR